MKVINNKKIITIIVGGLLLIIVGGLLIWNLNSANKIKLEEVVLKNDKVDSNMFAIMLEQEDGTYQEYKSDIWPQKENGYLFNEEMSGCMDVMGNTLNNSITWNNNIIKLKTTNASYCYLYFDIKKDFCIKQGFTNLADCLFVSENYIEDKDNSIDYIESKGNATTSAVAPTVTYVEKKFMQADDAGIINTTQHFTYAKSYTFDATTGRFNLVNYVEDNTISDKYIDYYTCGEGAIERTSCTTMYKIKDYVIDDAQRITEAEVYTFKVLDSFDSEVGLYKTTDEAGDTYFYRGAVKNNYVSYAGFIWRIVRINGNGSIRMIYSGTSTSATGADTSIGTSAYNSDYIDPTYVGYKYGKDLVQRETTRLVTNNKIANSVYYYGEGYTTTSDGRFMLDQTKTIKSGKWSEVYKDVIANAPYTCLKTTQDGTCRVVLHLKEYVSANQAKVYYISNNSKDYASTLTNTTDSTIKDYIDTWYESNIKDKTDSNGTLLSDYLSDEIFCNDRQLGSGDGYLISTNTQYSSYFRVTDQFVPSLLCSQASDKFSVANGNLTYPIALITIDEVILAGGKYGNVNSQTYLYTGQHYWTMTPAQYNISQPYASVWFVYQTGSLNAWNSVNLDIGVRPVINLKSTVEIKTGTGTADNPFIVTMPS